jgi:plasmid stabilization system protein ParE
MRKVVFSRIASRRLEALLLFLELEWSPNAKKQFIARLDASLNRLKKYPGSAPRSQTIPNLHRCVITRQTTIYYRFDKHTIKVVALFDTRQDPDNLNREINQ